MKLRFESEGCVTTEVMERNKAYARSLGLPYPRESEVKQLAVIGGGRSIIEHIETLRNWPGDRWILASGFPWCRQHGIQGTYFNIDPSENCIEEIEGVEKAILSTGVTPAVFDALKGKDVSLFELVETPERLNHGVTTATAVPELAIICGYTDVTFFGCESSYVGETHAYRNDVGVNLMAVDIECNGGRFESRPDYFMQAEFLSTMIRTFPTIFKEQSGGLLRALVADPDYQAVAVSRALYEQIRFEGKRNA